MSTSNSNFSITPDDKKKKNVHPDVQKVKSVSKANVLELVEPYMRKFDKKLEEMLDEFDTYDYTYKPLLNQVEFEEEFLILIRKLFRRTNKYELIYTIFEHLLSNTPTDLHKVLCLIDFMINISRFNPTVFKKLPNEVVSTIVNKPMFLRIQDYLYNKGRMNYQFKIFLKTRNVVELDDNTQDETMISSKSAKTIDHEFNASDSDDDVRPRKVMDVSLAELTKKIMSKTKKILPSNSEYFKIKKEESDNEDAVLLDNYESESSQYSLDETEDEDEDENEHSKIPRLQSDDNHDDYESSSRPKRSTGTKSVELSRLESLVQSDSSEYTSESESSLDSEVELTERVTRSRAVQKLNVPHQELHSDDDIEYDDPSMDAVSSILEHNMDYSEKDLPNLSKRNPEFLSFRVERVKLNKRRKVDTTVRKINFSKLKHAKPIKPKTKKTKAPKKTTIPPIVKRKTYYVVEKKLDFLYDELQRRIPKCNVTLLNKAVKGFNYKPAQYNLFTNLTEEETGMDETIRRNTDTLINTFIFQMYKRCGGNTFDKTQYVHPFEYNYIMENLELFKEKGVLLPSIIFTDRFSSLFDYKNNISENISLLRIKNTKIKGLRQIKIFENEDEYFNLFKKIVPRDQVAARISFLNKLVTDGVSLYVFDLIDQIRKLMVGNTRLTLDSEDEEATFKEKMETKTMETKEGAEVEKELVSADKTAQKGVLPEKSTEKNKSEAVVVGSQEAVESTKEMENQTETIETTKKVESPIETQESQINGATQMEIMTGITETKDSTEAKELIKCIEDQTGIREEVKASSHQTGARDVESQTEATQTEDQFNSNAVIDKTQTKQVETEEVIDQIETKESSNKLEPGKPNTLFTEDVTDPLDTVDKQNTESFITSAAKETAQHKFPVNSKSDETALRDFPIEMTNLPVVQQIPTDITSSHNSTQATNLTNVQLETETTTKTPKASSIEEEGMVEITEKNTSFSALKKKLKMDLIPDDEREAVLCSAKGINIPSKTVKRVLSDEESFKLLANILFPNLRLGPKFDGISLKSLDAISCSYDAFKSYLLALFLDDVFEFLRLPRFFKVDSTMFELQIQDMLKSSSPKSHIKHHSVSH